MANKDTFFAEIIKYYTFYDLLTGLLNRYGFSEYTNRLLINVNHQSLLAFIHLDIDNFKNINDTLGHQIADDLLLEVVKRIKMVVRHEDIIARIAGDEFVILVNDLDSVNDAKTIATKLLEQIRKPYTLGINTLYVNASIGIAMYPEAGEDYSHLLRSADIAMQKAKEYGKGTFEVYSEEFASDYKSKLFIEQSLYNAIDNEEFFLVYQPKFNLQTNKIVGIECLLRWQHPKLGLIYPEQFISIAEDSGLITPIGKWVLETACQQFEDWYKMTKEQLDFSIAINLSPKQFANSVFVDTIHQLLSTTSVPANRIELEVTESALMRNVKNEIFFQELHDFSLQLSIDDFGKEHSSFSRLKALPITSLKIDGSFVQGIEEGSVDSAIVKSIINIGKELGINVVAEGIETKEQLSFLAKNGCQQGQGYYFSKPLSVIEMTEFLLRHCK